MATVPSLPPGLESKYALSGNTLTRHVSVEQRKKYRVEVGDASLPSEFAPEVKLAAWDECYFSIRIPMLPGAKCEWEGDVLSYGNNNYQCRFYEKEHGYEYEVTMLRKPGNNSWTFDVVAEDVHLLYQRPLTAEALSMVTEDGDPVWGYGREDAPGSYLVTKASTFQNFTGGTKYELGIVGQIWRPKIVASNNQFAWCDMSYDAQARKLTVTIPSDFFASAPLPWVLDPELGYNPGVSEGTAPTYTYSLEGYIRGTSATASANGTVDEIHAYTNSSNGTRVCKMNLYTHAGDPVSNAASSEFTPAEFNVWRYRNYTYSSTKPTISSGTEYIPVCWASSGAGTHNIGCWDDSSSILHYWSGTYGTWPSGITFSATTTKAGAWIVYSTSGRTGSASITLDASTLSSAGTVKVAGAFSQALADIVLSSTSGKVLVQGVLSSLLADILLESAASQLSPISGVLSVTLGDAVLASAGAVALKGTSSLLLDPFGQSFAGKVLVKGNSGITLADLTPSSAGKVLVSGLGPIQLGDLILAGGAAGKVLVSGNAAVALQDLLTSTAGKVLVAGAASIPLADLLMLASGGAPPDIDEIILLLNGRICKKITDTIYIML